MADKPQIKLSVNPSTNEEWVLDGGVKVSRRFDVNLVERRPSKLPPRDVAADAADNRKTL
jgi:hypothetical protein